MNEEVNIPEVNEDVECNDGYVEILSVIDKIREKGETSDFTESNRLHLKKLFDLQKHRCKVILEIGVENNPNHHTSTSVFLNNKKDDTYYFGVDLNDKSALDNPEKRIYTKQTNSSHFDEVMSWIKDIAGTDVIDFLFIDGLHTIKQCKDDWQYVGQLDDRGFIGIHDINYHLGPKYLMDNLDKWIWYADEDLDGFGLAVLWRH